MNIFISYSHIDIEVAKKIEDILVKFSITYFLDIKDIEWGNSIGEEIKSNLKNASHLLVILSPASLKSQWVTFEIATALALEKKVLPFLVHPSLEVPQFLNDISFLKSLDDLSSYFGEIARNQGMKKDGVLSSSDLPRQEHDEILRKIERLIQKVHGTEDERVFKALETIYILKGTKRVGWSIRGVNEIESVAEHSFMAALLAEIFLPEHLNETDYDKSQVIRLLLFHDIGEAFSGNIVPQAKNEKSFSDYQKGIQDLDELLTFTGRSIEKIICEYDTNNTINARVASDIDKLEAYIQLHIYSSVYKFEDFESFKNHLESSVTTNVGLDIFELIGKAFE